MNTDLMTKQIDLRNPQLKGLEGSRVEVVTDEGEVRRFWVSSNHPDALVRIHITLKQIRSVGGYQADQHYRSVRVVRHCRRCLYLYSCGRGKV